MLLLGKTLYTVSVSTQVYKGIPVNLMVGITLQCTTIPFSRELNTCSCCMLEKSEINASSSLMGHLACMQT